MGLQIFDWFDKIPSISFLSVYKLACDTDEIHDRAALWLLYFFEGHSVAALNTSIILKSKSYKRQKEGAATSHGEAVD